VEISPGTPLFFLDAWRSKIIQLGYKNAIGNIKPCSIGAVASPFKHWTKKNNDYMHYFYFLKS